MNRKRVALIAHDHKKKELIDWVETNKEKMQKFELYATGTTGKMIEEKLNQKVIRLLSGPIGGDQQIGALIADGKIDILIFFWDPLHPLSHDPDIKALLRIAVVWNIPMACNHATADYILNSSLLFDNYERVKPDFSEHNDRKL
ncbi:methylglyoxal synthase [Chryseosolibacter indicus]|uniref:Methylglyoxal synthase n=1 Tax=Chryseosolibacter indicus TaxID=2782351 RepID=A0ABS5VKC1_9BACT|nr:methylglyoxal synthase [Chryseosolibacter indicus]MBT1701826.1 methylglyoxal synthase [Chryseosolibacter indicus]